jgi:hypothetical protein
VAAALAYGPLPAEALPPWDPAGAEAPAERAEPGAVEAEAEAEGSATNEQTSQADAATTGRSARIVASDELPPPPSDPNDAPFMRAPNNQIGTTPPRTRPDIRRGWSARRRVALSVAPAFASLRLPFQGRLKDNKAPRLPGAGVNVELDVQVHRWIWVRGLGIYSGHPVDEARAMQQNEVVEVAPRGTIHVVGYGGGPVFALDLGRFLPLIEVGVGGLQIVTPTGGIQGQRGQKCLSNNACDIGLKCNSARICEVSTVGEAYLGLAVDLMVRRHFSFGAQFRYNLPFSHLRGMNLVPGYMVGALRMSARF